MSQRIQTALTSVRSVSNPNPRIRLSVCPYIHELNYNKALYFQEFFFFTDDLDERRLKRGPSFEGGNTAAILNGNILIDVKLVI